MTRALVYIMSPLHVVSTVAALRVLHEKKVPTVTAFVHWPGLSGEAVAEIGKVAAEILRPFSFVDRIITMSSDEKGELMKDATLPDIVLALRRRIGDDYQEIYYAHDIEGGMFNLLCAAFPKAKRICFGDGLGNVYEKHVLLGFLFPDAYPAAAETDERKNGWLRKIVQRLRSQEPSRRTNLTLQDIVARQFSAHIASLILPIDQSGDFLKGIDLVVPNKEIVLDVLEACMSSSGELHRYIDDLVGRHHNREKYMLLTDNLAEGNFIEFDREIEMYCTILKERCAPASVVFLKSHPGENLPRNEAIRDRLSGVFDVEELDPKFKRYPIEMWKPLVTKSTLICLSYPVLSLKYLYGIDVIQPMDEAFIEKWFPQWTWVSYKNAVTIYMEPLKRLDGWDGKSLLWAGKVPGDNGTGTT
jgi:hypothetical protein